MNAETLASLIDYERSACLCDVGSPDYAAAVCVTTDGEDVLWLVSRNELAADQPHCGTADQRHEQLGRLPQSVRERIWGDALRCGRPTLSGRPCRQRVTNPGDSCGIHVKPVEDPP